MDRAGQSMDPYQSGTLRRNPWIAQESVDRAVRFMNFAYDTIFIVGVWTDL